VSTKAWLQQLAQPRIMTRNLFGMLPTSLVVHAAFCHVAGGMETAMALAFTAAAIKWLGFSLPAASC